MGGIRVHGSYELLSHSNTETSDCEACAIRTSADPEAGKCMFVRPTAVRVEWQLYELDTGELHRCQPKNGSHRTIDLPDWLARLLLDHIADPWPGIPARGRGAANRADACWTQW